MCDTELKLDERLGVYEPYGDDVNYSSDEATFDDQPEDEF